MIGPDALEGGTIEVLGLLPYSSNYAFLTKVGTWTLGESRTMPS